MRDTVFVKTVTRHSNDSICLLKLTKDKLLASANGFSIYYNVLYWIDGTYISIKSFYGSQYIFFA